MKSRLMLVPLAAAFMWAVVFFMVIIRREANTYPVLLVFSAVLSMIHLIWFICEWRWARKKD